MNNYRVKIYPLGLQSHEWQKVLNNTLIFFQQLAARFEGNRKKLLVERFKSTFRCFLFLYTFMEHHWTARTHSSRCLKRLDYVIITNSAAGYRLIMHDRCAPVRVWVRVFVCLRVRVCVCECELVCVWLRKTERCLSLVSIWCAWQRIWLNDWNVRARFSGYDKRRRASCWT